MTSKDHTIVSDFLTVLKVPHTTQYTRQRFDNMAFKTLFGVSNLLKDYGVNTTGYKISDPKDLSSIKTPFIAQTKGGLVIVTSLSSNNISYLTQGISESIPIDEFLKVWTGVVLCPEVLPHAKEPGYNSNLRMVIINKSKNILLYILCGLLLAYLLVINELWKFWSVWVLVAVDFGGLVLTYMLIQKSLNIKNHMADKVCGVLQEGGCDEILKTSASSFFGIFNWSEVGFTYFGISLIVMLVSPVTIHWLALINICCLPFTIWSIWYQKFRAKHWCTLCVCVQLSLWIQFICYLLGGWTAPVFPLKLAFFTLGALYVFVLLALNKILPHFSNQEH